MAFALVEGSGRVAQVEQEPPFEVALPFRWVPCSSAVRTEWTYADGKFLPAPGIPEPPVPASVSPYQARAALLDAGLLDQVEPAIERLPEPERRRAQLAWQWATAIERDSAFVATLGSALGLDDAQLDALFMRAAAL